MKRALVALAIVAVVGAVFFGLRLGRDKEERTRRAEERYLRFDTGEVTALDVVHGGATWRFERSPNGWDVHSPVVDRGDAERINFVLSFFNRSPVLDVIEQAGELSQYGLDPAVAEFRFEGVDAQPVFLGDAVGAGTGIYTRIEGRPGVLIAQVPSGSFFYDPDPMHLRERSVVGLPIPAVDRVEVQSGGRAFSLALGKDGWRIVEPDHLPASDTAVTKLLEALGGARIVGFLDRFPEEQKAASFGPAAPVVRLGGGGETRILRLGPVTEEQVMLVLRDDRPAVLAVEAGAMADLPLKQDRFLSGKITKVNRYAVTGFEYSRGGKTLRARKDGDGNWSADSGDGLDEEQVYSMLAGLLEARLAGWQKVAAGGRTTAELRFETEDGYSDRLRFMSDGVVLLDSLPEAAFRTSVELPPVPEAE